MYCLYLALMAMIFGSLSAIKESGIRRMIAFSSVAQVGYIYMGIGLGTRTGMIASVYHIFAHAAGKALLFISVIGLTDVSGFSRRFVDQTGAGYRNKIVGIGFTVRLSVYGGCACICRIYQQDFICPGSGEKIRASCCPP